MNTKSWAKLSLIISVLSLVVSIVALVNRCPTESPNGHVSFDYMGVIVGILALLVTALIGAQVGQYLFVDRKIETTAGKMARIIARKSANDIARNTARTVSEEVSERISKATIVDEIKNVGTEVSYTIKGQAFVNTAKSYRTFGFIMKTIDFYIKAIECYHQCTLPQLSQGLEDDAWLSVLQILKFSEDKGGVHVLEGQKAHYIDVLKASNNQPNELLLLLNKAQERPADYDDYLNDLEVKKMFGKDMTYEEWLAKRHSQD